HPLYIIKTDRTAWDPIMYLHGIFEPFWRVQCRKRRQRPTDPRPDGLRKNNRDQSAPPVERSNSTTALAPFTSGRMVVSINTKKTTASLTQSCCALHAK